MLCACVLVCVRVHVSSIRTLLPYIQGGPFDLRPGLIDETELSVTGQGEGGKRRVVGDRAMHFDGVL